ncbi:hypothetical protein BKP37_01800 [Anaerobacillus alkalilacustris]|uniref:DUF3939 domain-containing protein n=1 Tax=Anaerobacillus alkalilacustris TaxID=393763 RepID=A0A1S2LXN6_9BACI|nr:DUF3939 domain-containing protein [Anaerobacillus alkalilacustris]OIJ17261.1 hypothetical protein BKP37_01800 [Anaerobacillus alkalilacustris]
MFFKKRKSKQKGEVKEQIINVTIDQVRQAVNEYADGLKQGISLRTLILDDHSIDFHLLKGTLKGLPSQPFYMSKETFEIFETAELPKQIDNVQKAVDQYMQETGEEPIIPGNPDRRISYYLIRHYLHKKPEVELYLDKRDKMVTHRRPE